MILNHSDLSGHALYLCQVLGKYLKCFRVIKWKNEQRGINLKKVQIQKRVTILVF